LGIVLVQYYIIQYKVMKNKKETQIKQESQDEITAEFDLKDKYKHKNAVSMKDFG